MATITVRGTRSVEAATGSPAAVRIGRCPDTLSVAGTIPAQLDGCLLRAVHTPAWSGGAATAPLVEGGIRLSGGGARWYRRAAPACGRGEPFALDSAPLNRATTMTDRYLVVFDLPVVYQRAAALIGADFPYAWQEDRPARVGLLERGTDRPRWFTIRSCFVFNAANAYQDGDRVVIDAVAHERAFDRAAGPARPPRLWRWVLDLSDGTVDEGPLTDLAHELAVVDPRVKGQRHRYVFGAGLDETAAGGTDSSTTALVRHDLVLGSTQVRPLGHGRRCEQPVFVPRPAAGPHAESDGWLITVVHDLAEARSEVVILDATDLRREPVATVHLPVRLPPSRHTRWQPGG